MNSILFLSLLVVQPPTAEKAPLLRTVDLKVGEAQIVELSDGRKVDVKLVDLQETTDPIRGAMRSARVKVAIDGKEITLPTGNYRLPATFAGVQLDCPITRGYYANAGGDAWGLDKDARIRLWPEKSPLIEPGTFMYPARQRWFATMTQMANEPVYVDGGENPSVRKIYYHYGLDIGGAEGLVEVVAATDGLVVSARKELLPRYEGSPARPRYDVVYLMDNKGWYYRYSHFHTIDKEIRPGVRVKMGQRLGLLGKEGASGGWSHLHFDITSIQPSGKWGIQEGYAFLWEAYHREHKPRIIAVARPHRFVRTGDDVALDASPSWSAGKITRFDWTFTDGTTATGSQVTRKYAKVGSYSEVVKITDDRGQIDYDFAIVQVIDKDDEKKIPPTIHPAYYPTTGIKPGDDVTFKVRTFRTTQGEETWDFGDGTPKVRVKSDGNVVPLAKDGYAITTHKFDRPGQYVVRVERSTDDGRPAIAHLHVRVGD